MVYQEPFSFGRQAWRMVMLLLYLTLLNAAASTAEPSSKLLESDKQLLDRLSGNPPELSAACTSQLLVPLTQNCGFEITQLLRIASTGRIDISSLPGGVCEEDCGLAVYASVQTLDACSEVRTWLEAAQATPADIVRAVLGNAYAQVCQIPQEAVLPQKQKTPSIREPESREASPREEASPCDKVYTQCQVDGVIDETVQQLDSSSLFLADDWQCPAECVGAAVSLLTGPSCASELVELAVGRSAGALDRPAVKALLEGNDGLRRVCEHELSPSVKVNSVSMFITGLDPSPTTEGGTLGAVLVLRRILAEKAGVLTRYTSVHLSESPAGAPLVDLRATVVFAKDDWVDRYKFEALVFAGPAQLFAGTKVKHGNAILKSVHTDTSASLEEVVWVHPNFEQDSAASATTAGLWAYTVCLLAALATLYV